MNQFSANWHLLVEESPEWLFVRLEVSEGPRDPVPALAEAVWEHAETRSIYRMVFEIGHDVLLTSHLVGQFVLIHKRCYQNGGVMRICGLDASSYGVVQAMQLESRFPNYPSRGDAVMGHHPSDEGQPLDPS